MFKLITEGSPEGVVTPTLKESIATRIGHWSCWVFGGFRHSFMFDYQPKMLSLVCQNCGMRSSGWEVGKNVQSS